MFSKSGSVDGAIQFLRENPTYKGITYFPRSLWERITRCKPTRKQKVTVQNRYVPGSFVVTMGDLSVPERAFLNAYYRDNGEWPERQLVWAKTEPILADVEL